jgi:TRAP-type mannitol/chloroaromatic compound transport system substrate-binding protein
MNKIIYAIKVNELRSSVLKIISVKIGQTKNIKPTVAQYRRSNTEVDVLDLWECNPSMGCLDCEKGIHQIAEKYAYNRKGEKFVFLQESYKDFSDNVNLLLKNLLKKKNDTLLNKSIKKKKRIIKKLPQNIYRIVILETLMDFGGSTKAENVL